MAENKRSESTEVRSAAVPTPCVKGCGFYGTSSTLDMCSKCYREHLRQEQQRLQVESVCQQQQQQQKHDKGGLETVQGAELHDLSPLGKQQGEGRGTFDEAHTSQGYVAEVTPSETSQFVQESNVEQETQSLSKATEQGEHTEQKPKNRCQWCNKKVGLTGFSCRCGYVFCSEHRYSDKHNCNFDFKSQNKEILSKANPQVVASKINKI
ncbi:AN1-type zinc finger protein 5 [Galdieria sulphuraria]|uniref:Zinc finger (AN1-like) family protein n=1 Tax=Galdieria sulphuraria TaxID=130081 RepID=M2XMW7_GALSU|nr:zinc finger (AN1-like) family protein [Galdieria sulphuraria]EME31537.1 zinc finger (AN1-like) family protein [Galdieria sulphuraria]GJD10208.1 AN1-type zinc finger protein 5 [Galdieria sulphuraria]|eukprot:XP_005708057.1 zinc finger (AN1-like) family protein [Galdieria sulphuraria]